MVTTSDDYAEARNKHGITSTVGPVPEVKAPALSLQDIPEACRAQMLEVTQALGTVVTGMGKPGDIVAGHATLPEQSSTTTFANNFKKLQDCLSK